jgi:hypothetical protein
MLQTTRSKFSNRQISASCPLCGSEDEDKIHFILKCPDLASRRKYYIDELKSMLYEIDHDVSVNIVNNDELFIQLILDVTSPCIPMVFQSSTAQALDRWTLISSCLPRGYVFSGLVTM